MKKENEIIKKILNLTFISRNTIYLCFIFCIYGKKIYDNENPPKEYSILSCGSANANQSDAYVGNRPIE
jgi:hypothetical protein